MTIDELAVVVAIGAGVLLVAIFAVRLSVRTGLPSLLVYLGIGLFLGEDGLPHINFEDMELARTLGYVALILILAEGGLTTSWHEIKPSVAPAALLSTLGVGVSVFIVGLVAHFALHLDWTTSLLIGAILASTDAAAVFSVLRAVPLPQRLTSILEAESGFNDAPVVLLVVGLSHSAAVPTEGTSWAGLIGMMILELVGGALIGLLAGRLGAAAMRRSASASSGLFPLGVLAWVAFAYGVASLAHTSGFLATYVAALVLGNSRLPHRAAYRGFAQALGWLAQIGLFVMLGLLASPGELGSQLVPALILGTALLLLARPASVLVSMTPFRVPWRDQAFLSWAGLRGAVPIVLATVPQLSGVTHLDWIFDLVFVLVIVFTLVQAPLLPTVARWLRVTDPERARNLEVETSPLEELGADLLEVRIGDTSHLHGLEVFELRLPPGAEVTLVVRDGVGFVPTPETVLRHDDQLLIVATQGARSAAERQLQAVDLRGRLSGWPVAHSRKLPSWAARQAHLHRR